VVQEASRECENIPQLSVGLFLLARSISFDKIHGVGNLKEFAQFFLYIVLSYFATKFA